MLLYINKKRILIKNKVFKKELDTGPGERSWPVAISKARTVPRAGRQGHRNLEGAKPKLTKMPVRWQESEEEKDRGALCAVCPRCQNCYLRFCLISPSNTECGHLHHGWGQTSQKWQRVPSPAVSLGQTATEAMRS